MDNGRPGPSGGITMKAGPPRPGQRQPQPWPPQPESQSDRPGRSRLRRALRMFFLVAGILLAALALGLIGGALTGHL